uniref:Ferric-chelate reductase 1a n=1 Tax=Periophthalmus magnuspinnatus TaxID=409849 RepID=A0A3B4AFN3_9GOBI
MSQWCLSCFLLLLSLCLPVWPYPNGKVTQSCTSLEPYHHSQGQSSPSPYLLQANASSFSPGDHVEVTLSGQVFKGFLLQARDPTQSVPSAVGSFSLTDPRSTQLLTCNKHQGSAVSHTSKSHKSLVRVIWRVPNVAPAQVQFFVTVVSHYDKYWVKVPGPIITLHGVTPRPPVPTPSSAPTPKPTSSVLPGPFSSEGCGLSKSCLLDPPGCDPSHHPDCFYLSATTQGPPEQQVLFELSGPSKGYIAFALSWDTWMGDDDVYLCLNEYGRVSVEAAILRGRTPPKESTQVRRLLRQPQQITDGIIQCRFSRPVKPTNQDSDRFDLEQEYFLFVANGPAYQGSIGKHSQQPLVSEGRVRLTGTPITLRGSRGPTLLKVHGALMLLAWMLTGSIGTFIASFYKNEWASHTLCGQKIWFQVHRGLMMLTVALTAVGFCLPFVYRRGWSTPAGVHPYLGCCVLALSLLQPITACARPPPDSPRLLYLTHPHTYYPQSSAAATVDTLSIFTAVSSHSVHLSNYTICILHYSNLLDFQSAPGQLCKSHPSLVLPVVVLGNLGLLSALLSSVTQL